jgi:hypothetical protein
LGGRIDSRTLIRKPAFAAGVVFHKYVISEAEKIKQAVLASEQRIRTDVASFLTKTGGDVTKVASKV